MGDSTALGIEIESRFQGLESPAKMKLAVTGCPRNCAESYVQGRRAWSAIEGGRWEIYVGGAAGAHIRKGDLLATVDDAELVKTLTGRFMQYYRENANWLERTYDFVPRVGIEVLRDGDRATTASGIAADLDERMQQRDRRLPGPVAGGRRARHPRPVPHLAAARGAAAGAGPMTARADQRRPADSARSSRSRWARVGPSRSHGEQVAVFRLRDGRVFAVGAVCPHRGRTDRRRPDRRARSSCARCT